MSRPDPYAKYGGKAEEEDPYAKYGGQVETPSLATEIKPTLLASRQEIAKQQFEAAQPRPTMFSQARDLTLGALEGLGVDTASPVSGTVGKLASAIGAIPQIPRQILQHPIETGKSLAQPLIAGPQEAYKGFEAGDYGQMAHGVGQTLAVDLPAIAGIGAAAKEVLPSQARAAGKLAQVMAAGKDVENPLVATQSALSRVKQLQLAGTPASGPAKQLMKFTEPGMPPLTYGPQGVDLPGTFDLASAQKRLSVPDIEAARSTPMEAMNAQLARALQTDNRALAQQIGMEKLFDEGMKEYSQWARLTDAAAIARKYLTRAALGGTLYGMYKKLR